MSTTNHLAKIRRAGLNAFGEPYRGNTIRGVQRRRMMGGTDSRPLSQRGPEATGEIAAQEELAAAEVRAQAMAREAGRRRAQAEMQGSAGNAPAPASQDTPSPDGAGNAGGWFGGLVQRGREALLVASRRARAAQAAQGRAAGRARYQAEREQFARPDTYAPFDATV